MIRDHSDKPLMLLFMHIGKLLQERLRGSLSEGGIHFGQARILVALLRHDQLTQGTMGRRLDIKPATVTNLVKKLEASGLIDRRQDANDDRIMNVTLTAKGREAANFAVSVMEQVEDDIRSELTQKEIGTLRDPLLRVRNSLGGSDPGIV
jgi:DNA-binding MarR family transcriptional regulator